MQNLSILLEILLSGNFGKNATYSVDRTVNKVGYDCTLVVVSEKWKGQVAKSV